MKTFGRLSAYRGSWRIDARPFGYLYTRNGMKFESKRDAQAFLDGIRGELARLKKGEGPETVLRRYLPHDHKQQRVGYLFERYARLMQQRADAGELSPPYAEELQRLLSPAGHFGPLLERSVHSLRYGVLEDWLSGLQVAGATKRKAAAILRAFLRWLKRRGDLDEVPDFPPVRVEEYEPTVIEIADQDRVLAAIPEERRGAFLAMRLGIRPNEARAFNVEDYDPAQRTLRVGHGMKGAGAQAPRRGPKTGRGRTIQVDDELADWIARHRRQAFPLEPLFTNANARTGSRWLWWPLHHQWKQAAASVGVECGLYEGTKHSSASAAVRRGQDLYAVQKALGHADARSTARYARLHPTVPVSVLRPV